jgi:hypothetical protein
MKRFLQRGRSLVALVLLTPFGLVGGSATSASASGGSCNLGDGGTVCIKVDGTGLHVDSVNVGYTSFKGPAQELCFYGATFDVHDPSGSLWDAGTQFHDGCTFGGFYFDWRNLNESFPDHSHVCGHFYADHFNHDLGVACVEVHS